MNKGKVFEEFATNYLKRLGYKILDRNVRTPYGEVDILAEYRGKKVIVEVKGGEIFNPVENFNKRKLKRLIESGYHLFKNEDFRIDLIVVFRGKIKHYKNVERYYGEPWI